MGGCCSGFGWVGWGGLGTIGLILNLVLFVGLLVAPPLRRTGPPPWGSPSSDWRRGISLLRNLKRSATGFGPSPYYLKVRRTLQVRRTVVLTNKRVRDNI